MTLKRDLLNVPNYSIALTEKDATSKDWFKYLGDLGDASKTLEDDLNTAVEDLTTTITDGLDTLETTLTTTINQNTPPGVIFPYAGSTAPTGWLLCDGSAVSRTTYAALFALISTTYGVGDGSTTFNLPDTRSRMTIGAGAGTGLTSRTLASTGGAETHTLTVAQIPANIPVSQGQISIAYGSTVSGINFPTAAENVAGTNTKTYNVTSQTASGSGNSHPIMNPFLALNHIIKF